MTDANPRDLIGYGRNRPNPEWPGNARIAVQFVINHEEGAELNVLAWRQRIGILAVGIWFRDAAVGRSLSAGRVDVRIRHSCRLLATA